MIKMHRTVLAGWRVAGSLGRSKWRPAPLSGSALIASLMASTVLPAYAGDNAASADMAVPFVISVDGQAVDTSGAFKGARNPADGTRKTDVGLNAMDIQVKFDGLDARTQLNVSTVPVRRSYKAGDAVRFLATSNYPDFIERSEIRIYELEQEGAVDTEAATVVPVAINGEAEWTMPASDIPGKDREFLYVLRVYDRMGRYDETAPLTIARTNRDFEAATEPAVAPGMGEDRTARKDIPVSGGAVTVFGRNVPTGGRAEAFGDEIPVDRDGKFVVQRILPAGKLSVDVAVTGAKGGGALEFKREIDIPKNDWFFIGLADLTVGRRTGDRGIEAVREGEYDKVYSKGRLAFYLKGKIKGEYLLTAAADSNEEDLRDLFGNLDQKDVRQLLKNLDPDDFYPVYGDDSTLIEDAPTDGRFYVRLDHKDSHVMWGNYKTRITGTEFLRSDRQLYGGHASYNSEEVTSFGERRTSVSAYGAQPDTLPQRDSFLATGGSAYFMKQHDIISSSETVTVETRDAVTGAVLSRKTLVYGEDYNFDYMQGLLLLASPLSSSGGTSSAVRDGALGGNKVYVVVQYDYTPAMDDVDGYTYGGRAEHWFGDKLRIGVTGQRESSGETGQRAYGVDVRLRQSEKTYLDLEMAHSGGAGFGTDTSADGGLTWDEEPATDEDGDAIAWRLKGQADLAELTNGRMSGQIDGYYQRKEDGFSTLTSETAVEQRLWGLHSAVDLTSALTLGLAYDDYQDGYGRVKRSGKSDLAWQMDDHWKVSFGTIYTDVYNPLSSNPGWDGRRVDAGVRLDYRFDDDHLVYGFGQGTASRSGDIRRNDRIGVGAEVALTDTIGTKGEVSYGTLGFGALAAITYDPTPDDHYYFGYRLDPERAYDPSSDYELQGADGGTFVTGAKRRMGDLASAYAERSYDMFGRRQSLTETYGVLYTPDAVWSFDGSFEAGRVEDDTIDSSTGLERSDYDRYAPAVGVRYSDKEMGIDARLRGEVRIEDSEDGTRNQNTYYLTGALNWNTSEDWRLLTQAKTVVSHGTSAASSLDDTDYTEFSLGYAYRPVDNDRLNMLFKYTWLYDVTEDDDSVSSGAGDSDDPAQVSHILSADINYDLYPWLTLGAKYGFRIGRVRGGLAGSDSWEQSSAHLGIARVDLHIVKSWDLLVEGRVLRTPEADTTDFGALAAVYRHIGDNFKVGAGYNFGRFSDDLRDLTLNDKGVFLNVIGKF